jgi:hypothetical protein
VADGVVLCDRCSQRGLDAGPFSVQAGNDGPKCLSGNILNLRNRL